MTHQGVKAGRVATVADLMRAATRTLQAASIANAGQEARWLLEHATGAPLDRFILEPATALAPRATRRFRTLIERRCAGEPLQYILGSVLFHGLELAVGPGVLIPRPETERLVDFALARWPGQGAVCDVCTGSGAIALALAVQLPPSTPVVGTDISERALRYARRNRTRLGLTGVRFRRGDLFTSLGRGRRFALITANPPYVAGSDFEALSPVVRLHEPREALWAAAEGMSVIARIADECRVHLEPDGWILCEIGDDQGPRADALFRRNGFVDVQVRQDYTGRDRVVEARMPEK